MTRTDHAAIAEARVDDAAAIAPERTTSNLDTAHLIYTEAAVHAMLALAAEQRTANLIAYLSSARIQAAEFETVRSRIREDLGL